MEDTEHEEGEAGHCKDSTGLDPDIALSYIDEKLQSVLGHFQKDFEGGVSAENLGAKFGGYGSFLPTYQRSPAICSQPKTPQRVQNSSSPRSPNVLPVEGAPQNSTAPSVAAVSLRVHSLHTARGPSGDVSSKQNSCSSSAQIIEHFPPKHEPVSNKPVKPTDQRTLKVRIKVGSDCITRKNAAIYSGLGLISPSSSLGNSTEESGGMPSECHETLDEQHSILGIMTSFHVPGGLLLSPLHESLLGLTRKEKLPQNNKPIHAIKSSQELSAALADDSASLTGDKKVLKEKKTKRVEKSDTSVVLKQEIDTGFDDNRTTIAKREVAIEARNLENETPYKKQCLSNHTKLKPLSNSVWNVVSVKGAAMAPEVPREVKRNIPMKNREFIKAGMEERFSTGLVKEESLESISDQNGCKYDKAEARGSSMEKICRSRLSNSHRDVSTDLREDGQSNDNKVSAPFKAGNDVSKCKRDPNIGAADHSKQKVGQTGTYHEQDEIKMPHGVGKSSFEGKKKSKGSQSNRKPASEAEESLMAEVYEAPKEKKKAGKIHNSKSHKVIRKVHENCKEVLPEIRVEQMNNQMDSLERPFGDKEKDSKLEAVEKEQCAFLDKSKNISTRTKVDTQLTSETFLKETANDACPAKGVTSEMELTSVAPIVIEEDWVCCDHCQKWRLLPYGTKPEQLPEKWLCNMLNWLPGMNHCDISEEETTKALHALYQLPLSESQNNPENHVGRTTAGASSADAWRFDQNDQNLGSHGMPNPRKKKQGSKEAPYAASNGGPNQISGSTKKFQEDLVKSRSLNDMNQPNLQSNLTSNSNVLHLSKSRNFPVEKKTQKQKEKHVNIGDAKQKNLKSRREADQYGPGTTKKIKVDVAFDIDKSRTAGHSGNLGKIGRGLPTKVALKSIEKHDEHCYSKDAKSDRKEKVQMSVKKRGEHASVHTRSLNMKTCDEREISLKKRKLKDWQESQNYVETSRNNGNHLPESKVFVKEECSDSEFRRAKKSRVSSTDGKESNTSKGDSRLNRKGKVTRILLSGIRENPVHGREEVRSIQKDQQPRKHKTKVQSKPASDNVDSLKRDLGSEQFSRAATSSSSKVSDSRKSRAHFQEVKGSPVESVSSSPMRISNLDKLSLSRRDILGKDATRNGDCPVMDSPRKSLEGEGNIENNRSGTARRVKVSGVSHSDSLCFPVLDYRDNNASQKFGGKSKSSVRPPEFRNSHVVNNGADYLKSPYPDDLHASDHCYNEDRLNKNHYHDNATFPQKSGKGSSLLSKDKDRSSGNNSERVKVKLSDPPNEMEVLNPKQSLRDEVETGPCHVALLHEESSDLKCRIKLIKDGKSVGSMGSGKWANETGRENQLEFVEHDGSAVKLGALCHTDGRVTPQQNLTQDFEVEVAKKIDQAQVESRGGNSQVFPRHVGKQDPLAHVPQPLPGLQKGSAFDVIPVDSSRNGDISKVLKQTTNIINHLGCPVPNRHALKEAPSPLRRDAADASNHVASNALKEAEGLRDYADHLKDSGFGFECNEAYFQAALKFLHSASLLETCNGDSSKHGERSQMQIYNSTAELCEICAREYEKSQEMAAAALAYKCMEVAYLKVVYCKNSRTNRDRHDLQEQMVPQGESPSSSASDVDNLNNQTMVDKAALSKGISGHAGNRIIFAHNHPNFVRLLDFTKDVNSAMEASRKTQSAFAAASVILERAQNEEGIISVKRVIDFSFQDVEELIRLVRLAIEAISRQGFSGTKD